jgi:hypothetical protein
MTSAFLTSCLFSASLLAAGACLAAPASNPNNPNNNVYTGWSWSGHVDHINIDKEAAAEQFIEDTATAIGGAAEYYSSTTENTLVLGMNFLFYNDNAEFAQFIRDYWGDVNYTESDASAFMLFAEYGPKYRFGQDNMSFFTVRGGVSGMLYSERAISYCSNCYSEDIDIDGGVYGVLGIGQTLGSVDIGLQFQQYFSGDLDNSIRLKISGAF